MNDKKQHIVILGSPAVGKLTTAKSISAKLFYPLFDNSKVIDIATLLYEYGTDEHKFYRNELRFDFYRRAALNNNLKGLISTNVLKKKENWNHFIKIKKDFDAAGWETHFFILIAQEEVLLQRAEDPSRKTKMVFNNALKLKEWLGNNPNHSFPLDKTVKVIDNSFLTAEEVAEQIIESIYDR